MVRLVPSLMWSDQRAVEFERRATLHSRRRPSRPSWLAGLAWPPPSHTSVQPCNLVNSMRTPHQQRDLRYDANAVRRYKLRECGTNTASTHTLFGSLGSRPCPNGIANLAKLSTVCKSKSVDTEIQVLLPRVHRSRAARRPQLQKHDGYRSWGCMSQAL